jgi:hypothetical protein
MSNPPHVYEKMGVIEHSQRNGIRAFDVGAYYALPSSLAALRAVGRFRVPEPPTDIAI